MLDWVKHVSVRDMFVCFVMYLLNKGSLPHWQRDSALLIMHIYTYIVISAYNRMVLSKL